MNRSENETKCNVSALKMKRNEAVSALKMKAKGLFLPRKLSRWSVCELKRKKGGMYLYYLFLAPDLHPR